MTTEQIIADLDRISMACAQNLSATGMTLAQELKSRLLRREKEKQEHNWSFQHSILGVPPVPQTTIGANP